MSGKKTKAERRREQSVAPPSPPPETPVSPSGPLLLIRVLALIGLGISAYLSAVHYQTGPDGIMVVPFCEAGAVIDCKSVLNSAYAKLFGFPVALWAAISYAGLLALSFLSQATLLIMACLWMFVFALYMASVSFLKLQSVCLFCTGLYLVNLGLLVGAIMLARSQDDFGRFQFAFGLLGCAVLVGGISVYQTQQAAAHISPLDFIAPPASRIDMNFVNYYNEQREVSVQAEARHVKGEQSAPLTITEFVDFRCPSCATARNFLAQLYAANKDDVRVVFHHYPLDQSCNPIGQQVHPSACAAAVASECAAEQDRFWDYADRLFANQKRFTREDFEAHAAVLDLDLERFTACLDDGRMNEQVRQDIEEGRRLEIKATPTLVINGRIIEGLPPPEKLATLITVEKQKK